MKPAQHARATAAVHGRIAGALAVLPDLGVLAQRVPVGAVRRAGARFHHSAGAADLAARISVTLGAAWAAHYAQDEQTHPPGTYGIPEAARIPPDRVVAYSGGPDSFITWRLLGHPPAVYLDVGNASAADEIFLAAAAFNQFGGDLTVSRGPWLAELPSGWIPYRNMLIVIACGQVAPDVVLARIAEWGPDKNPAFFRHLTRLLASSRGGWFQGAQDLPAIRVHTPFGHLTKTQLVARYLQVYGRRQGEQDLERYTRSCYAGGDMWCGRCGACWCRWVAWHNNGLHGEDGRYAQPPARLEYYRRLHWRDARPSMIGMYVKRAAEMRGHGEEPR